MTKGIKTQVMQFSFIGISNAAIDILSLNALLFLWPTTQNYLLLLFNTISYLLAILNSYFWNTKYTFNNHSKINIKEMTLFVIQAIIALAISNLVFILSIELLNRQTIFSISSFLNQNIAKGLAMLLSSTASFFFMKFFVFRKKNM